MSLAYVFPGQGSQSIGMLGDLSNKYPFIIEIFDIVSDRLGYNVWHLIQQGPEATLSQTEYTQVAMLTSDVAMYRLAQLKEVPTPTIMAGHSLGEYAALVCAEAISLADAANLVSKRGQIMQEMVPLGQGAMAAIVGLSNEQVESICKEVTTKTFQVNPANYNAIGQVVIAGHSEGVQEAIVLAEKKGARLAKVIPVSVPCHCGLLKEASETFASFLNEANFKVPMIPVVSNVDLSIYDSPKQIKKLLKEQLYSPVRWVETIQKIQETGVESIIECGPGNVLSGLIKRIDKTIKVQNIKEILLGS